MEMIIDFPGGARVDAHFESFTVPTDQPSPGYPGVAPSPFLLFLSSIGTCAGIYALGFCRKRGLPTEGMQIIQRIDTDPTTGLPSRIDLEIKAPQGFPEEYLPALARSAELCKVKKTIEQPPVFSVSAVRQASPTA